MRVIAGPNWTVDDVARYVTANGADVGDDGDGQVILYTGLYVTPTTQNLVALGDGDFDETGNPIFSPNDLTTGETLIIL